MQEEVLRIWEATDQTWYAYVRGSSGDLGRAMWIIRWLLWRAFSEPVPDDTVCTHGDTN